MTDKEHHNKDLNQGHSHCPEVNQLLQGKFPFVTRYGIFVVIVVFLIIAFFVFLSKGAAQQLLMEVVEHTIEQIKLKI